MGTKSIMSQSKTKYHGIGEAEDKPTNNKKLSIWGSFFVFLIIVLAVGLVLAFVIPNKSPENKGK